MILNWGAHQDSRVRIRHIYNTTNGNWSCEFQAQYLMDEATDSGRMEAIKRD